MRYKFYREHKYVCAAINDVERLIAKTDFSSRINGEKVKEAFDSLVHMLKAHAHYENSILHELLRKKKSAVFEHVEEDHVKYEEYLEELRLALEKTITSSNLEEQNERGYQFYLSFRKFAALNLLHLHEEETLILPELQKLYSDEELARVEFSSYSVMTPKDLVHMMQLLFPHMNSADREVFLTDIKACDNTKFVHAWAKIKAFIEPQERAHLALKLGQNP